VAAGIILRLYINNWDGHIGETLAEEARHGTALAHMVAKLKEALNL